LGKKRKKKKKQNATLKEGEKKNPSQGSLLRDEKRAPLWGEKKKKENGVFRRGKEKKPPHSTYIPAPARLGGERKGKEDGNGNPITLNTEKKKINTKKAGRRL